MLLKNKSKDRNENRDENDLRNRNKSDFEDIENLKFSKKNSSHKTNFEYDEEDVAVKKQGSTVPQGIGALKVEILEVGSSSSSTYLINEWQEDLRRAVNIGLYDSTIDAVISTQSGMEWTCESTSEFFENQFSDCYHQNGKSLSSVRGHRQGGPSGGSMRGQDRGQDRMNIINITTNCVKYLVSSLIIECSTLSALIRNDVLDTDLEVQAHLSNLIRHRNSLNNINTNEDENKEKIFNENESEIESEKEEKNGKFLRSKSILDANNVTLGQNSIPLLPSEILIKSRIIFQKAENISTIITSFFEIILFIQDEKKTKNIFNSNSNIEEENIKNEKILAEKLKMMLNFLLEASCATIECVSKILYVLPCPYIVSVTDWARTISGFLHFRSASMYVLTLCHRYNTMRKENVSTSGQNSMKKSVKAYLLSPINLETVLLDMEDIRNEEVNKINEIHIYLSLFVLFCIEMSNRYLFSVTIFYFYFYFYFYFCFFFISFFILVDGAYAKRDKNDV